MAYATGQLQLQALREALRANAAVCFDTMLKWDSDRTGTISIPELNGAIGEMGYDANEETVAALFDDLDNDGSGTVAFAELKRWLEPRMDSKQKLHQNIDNRECKAIGEWLS